MEISEPPCYTLLSNPSDIEPPNEIQLKWDLENGETESKIRALKKIIRYISNGDRLPGLLFPIIRYVLPSQDHVIKKLLLIFWEIVPKTTPDGNLLQEIILVCDAYRKDLEHPNEFVRGSTLRFLCKLKEPELLEPLMPAIRSSLKHKSSYVRRNAVLAIFTIYKNFPFLFPDATELIANFIEGEENMSCKRNAFLMLLHTDLERAFSYLLSCLDQVSSFGDILQLMVVQLINKVCRENPSERPRFIRCIYSLLNSNSPAVRYEAAGTLILSCAPTAIKAAASCYIDLIVKESDNNVKLIVLDRLISLKESPVHGKVLEDLVMHILRVLSSSDLEVKEKTLNLVLDLTTSRSVKDVTSVLKKEISKVHKIGDHEEDEKYLQLLVKALHSCCLQFPYIASDIIPPLMDYLGDAMESVSYDIIVFLREAVHKFEPLRTVILDKLIDIFSSLKYLQVYRVALWILGEYATSSTHIENILKQIKCSIGRIPILEEEFKDKPNSIEKACHKSQVNFVTPDGAYATQSCLASITLKSETSTLKQYLLDGNFIIGVSLARALVKLALHYRASENTERLWNKFISECMLIISCVMNFGKSNPQCVSLDDLHHMLLCLKILSEPSKNINEIFLLRCREAISNIFSIQDNENYSMDNLKRLPSYKNEVDDVVKFSQLSQLSILDIDPENTPQISLYQAVLGFTPVNKHSDRFLSLGNLDRVTQLTGISDPVYAEAYVHSNQYNIVLDVFIVNQTDDLLQNCTLELATLGDLKLVEKSPPCVLAPHDFSNIKAVIKVSSTENGVIFGNIVYDLSGVASDNIVILNDIRIDIKDYIAPTKCTDAEFRKMWAVFEWENKISVSTGINDLRKYLDYLLKSTNMKCLTPEKVLCGQCEFLSANLYARSIFGEDALVNVSLEKSIHTTKSTVTGHIRVRTKSQGMALYLGEMMNKVQKDSAAIHTTV